MVIRERHSNKLIKLFLLITLIMNNVEKEYYLFIDNKYSSLLSTNSSSLKIFIMTHKDFVNPRYNPVYNIVADNKGQLKNKYIHKIFYSKKSKLYNMRRAYGEMSKLYFIYQLYKKGILSSKYIGLNHYRRFFYFGDNIPYLEGIFEKYDVVLSKEKRLKKNIMNHYCESHICKNYIEVLDIINENKPEYYNTAKRISKIRKIYICNMFIMKTIDFFKYCEFVFDILFEFDKRNNFTSDNDVLNYVKKYYVKSDRRYYQSRIQGFLAERLSNIFFRYHFKRIKMLAVEEIL